MATISKDPQSGNYNVRFRYGERAYRRSLKTPSKKEALSALGRVEETMRLLARGSLLMPPEADPATYIMTGGRVESPPRALPAQTLGELFDLYEQTLPEGAKEKSTLKTERIHMAHLGRVLNRKTHLRTLSPAAIQQYIRTRLSERNGSSVKPVTVRKEVATFRFLWNWAVAQGLLQRVAPTKGLQYPKSDEQLPFMTWAEIESVIARGGLAEQEETQLWASLYLDTGQVESILRHVEAHALHPQIYPMILFAAHTGARCSEILRSRIEDFDFGSRIIRIREKKRTQKKAITFRHVPMTQLVHKVFTKWFADHPGGHP